MPSTSAAAKSSEAIAHQPMRFVEFVVVVAAIMALNPLAMDIMLPALPNIGAALHIDNPNRLHAILSMFLLGFGMGQCVVGPLSDRFGRRGILMLGLLLYIAAALLAVWAPTFEILLIARFLQGLGTSATRVIATSVVRDCYSGHRMAKVMSLTMIVFITVPVLAPSFGQLVMLMTDWHGLFWVLAAVGVTILGWCALRLPETLPINRRKAITPGVVLSNFRHTLTTRQTIGYALAAGAVQGTLFSYIFTAQQVFSEIYDIGVYFPLAFAGIAIGFALAGFANSRLVGRFSMRAISHSALMAYLALAVVIFVLLATKTMSLPVYLLVAVCSNFTFGIIFPNFTAMAMEPQGHIAGTASSMYGTVTTLTGMSIAYVIGQFYDGTLWPFEIGFLICAISTVSIVLFVERGRLFGRTLKPS